MRNQNYIIMNCELIEKLHNVGLNDEDIKEVEEFEEYKPELVEDNRMVDIYVIENLVNGKKYCGQAVVEDYRGRPHGTNGRWKSHMYESTIFKNLESHCWVLNRSINKYGAENFSVKTIQTVPRADAGQAEIDAIANYNSQVPAGMNILSGGQGWRGKHSDAAKEKNSKMKRREGDEDLPMYVSKINPAPEVWGYGIKYPKAKYRSFCSMRMTMEEKLEKATAYLDAVKNDQPVGVSPHNMDLPKFIQYRPARRGRSEGLRVEIKSDKKIIFCKSFHAGTYDEKLQNAKKCVAQAKLDGIFE